MLPACLSWHPVQANDPRDSNRYLRLSQFLDLQARWMGTAEPGELAHRIRQTVGLLVPSDEVDIELLSGPGKDRPLDGETGGVAGRPARESGLVRRALASMARRPSAWLKAALILATQP